MYFAFLIIVLAICLAIAIGFYFLLKNYLHIDEQVALMICIALLIIILPALQKHLKSQLDKYIKQEFIDLSVQDKEFANSLNQAHQLDELLFKVAGFIKSKIKVDDILFLVRDIRTPELKYICQCPKDEAVSFIDDLPLLNDYFQKHPELLISEEISHLNLGENYDKKIIKKLRNFIEANDAQIIIPLVQSDVVHGFILLMRKQDCTLYTQEEVSLLSRLSQQVSFVIDRVMFYEETMERVRREFGGRK
jgi:GAF domain-containing protein